MAKAILATKRCCLCGEEKQVSEFNIRTKADPRPRSRCKSCSAEPDRLRAKAWHESHADHVRERDKKKRQQNKGAPTSEARRKWERENKERLNAIKKAYRDRNKEKLSEAQAERIARNPERRKATTAKWYAKNRDRCRNYTKARRDFQKIATPSFDSDLDDFVFVEAIRLAKMRLEATGIQWDVDHIEPIISPVVCGLHNAFNIAVVPATFNRSKGNKQIDQHWIKYV